MRIRSVLLLLAVSLGLAACNGPSPQDATLFFMDNLLRGNPAAADMVCDAKQDAAEQILRTTHLKEQDAGVAWYNTKDLKVEMVEKRDDTALVRIHGTVEKHWSQGRIDKQPVNAFYSLVRAPSGWKVCF